MTATQALETLSSFSLQIFVVILATTLVDRTVDKPADRCVLWSTCFSSILFLAVTSLLLPRLHVYQPWRSLESQTLTSVAAMQATIAEFLLTVWAFGAAVSLAKWLVHGFWLRTALGRCETVPRHRVCELLGMDQDSCLVTVVPRLLISDEAVGPYCVQLQNPIIVLPRNLMEGSHHDLQNVLIHELAHLRNNHPVQLFLQQLVQVICWFHPSIWRASSRASLVREYVCDDAVINRGVRCDDYLRTLLLIAERSSKPWHASAIGFGPMPTELILRAKRLVAFAQGQRDEAGANRSMTKRLAIVIVLISACCMTLVSVPTDPMTSSRTAWSAWPSWTAECLHCFGINLRDYERFDRRVRAYELLQDDKDTDAFEPVPIRGA
jgi:beta-lactamase regulating signal transducer with metallopeptidase domain